MLNDGKGVERKRVILHSLRFDEHGNRTESTTYREDGAVSEKLIYTYDVLGRNTGYNEYYSLTNQPLLGPRKHIYTLDEGGRIVEYMVYDSGGSIADRFTYQYDARGNKLEENFYSWVGKRIGRLVYAYDDVGHLLAETSYDRDDAVAWKNVSSYDPEGHQLEWVQYQKGVLRYKKMSKYDDEGRITEQQTSEFNAPPNVYVSHAPVPGKIVYSYNDRERFKEIATYDPNGSLRTREVRTLDEKGNEIGWAYFNADGSPKNTEINFYDKNKLVGTLSGKALLKFEYDSHGNWTKKAHLILPAGAREQEAWSADYRIITYYKND